MRSFPRRLYLLDLGRGIASLVIVIFHYGHFFSDRPGHFDVKGSLPFSAILWPVYQSGVFAVQVFFALSGFVFFFNYYDHIASGGVSAYKFFVLRFSRLYPLHFVTLLYVAFLQFLFKAQTGQFFVYPANDARHFVLNLLFIQQWGLKWEWSFNGPTWSVSIEVLLYSLFFVIALKLKSSMKVTLALMLAGFAMSYIPARSPDFRDIGVGIYCFFGGGAAYLIYERLPGTRAIWFAVAAFTTSVAALVIFHHIHAPFGFSRSVLFGVCFPSVILFLAALQDRRHERGRKIRFVGDITYSTYLLHFPIQITIVFLINVLGIAVNFLNPSVFIAYIALVVALSIPTYYGFERPVQNYLRDKMSGAPRVLEPATS